MTTTPMSPFAKSIYLAKYAARDEQGELVEHDWSETAQRVVPTVLGALGYGPESEEVVALTKLVEDRKFIPGGRYLYATGKDYHQTNNCLLLRADDSREGWADLFHKAAMSLQTGAGIGVDYSAVRAKGSRIKRTGGIASGPIELMKAVNELGRSVMQGGNRRSAIWAGLKWSHPDVFDFIHLKDWPDYIKAAKEWANGTCSKEPFYGTMKDGTVTLGSFGPGVDAATRTIIETKKAEIIAGTFAPFTGPINKQDGSEWLKAGQTADLGFLLGDMTFFVEGVEGLAKD